MAPQFSYNGRKIIVTKFEFYKGPEIIPASCMLEDIENKILNQMAIPMYILNPQSFKGLIIITEEVESGEG